MKIKIFDTDVPIIKEVCFYLNKIDRIKQKLIKCT